MEGGAPYHDGYNTNELDRISPNEIIAGLRAAIKRLEAARA